MISDFNKKWANKKLYFCPSIYSEINFTYSLIRACCLCTLYPYTPPIVYANKYKNFNKFNLKEYLKQIDRIMTLNQTAKAVCADCDFFKKQLVPSIELDGNIKTFSFNHFTKCNANCIYCFCSNKEQDSAYKTLPIIKRFIEYGLIKSDCLFNWAGGEPLVCDEFNECFTYLYDNKFKQRVNSSGIEFSEAVLKGLKTNLVDLVISPDSGTSETYLKVKRVDCFDKVWNNIKKYAQYPDNLYVKYVLFSMNSNPEDITKFVEKCVESGVRHIAITVENNTSHGDGKNFGPITDNEINMAILLKKLAQKESINYSIWPMWKEENVKRIEAG